MKIRRKVVSVGSSRAVTIPTDFFVEIAVKHACTFTEVYVTWNRGKLVIEPILEEMAKGENKEETQ